MYNFVSHLFFLICNSYRFTGTQISFFLFFFFCLLPPKSFFQSEWFKNICALELRNLQICSLLSLSYLQRLPSYTIPICICFGFGLIARKPLVWSEWFAVIFDLKSRDLQLCFLHLFSYLSLLPSYRTHTFLFFSFFPFYRTNHWSHPNYYQERCSIHWRCTTLFSMTFVVSVMQMMFLGQNLLLCSWKWRR